MARVPIALTSARRSLSFAGPVGIALISSAMLCAWAAQSLEQVARPETVPADGAACAYAKETEAQSARVVISKDRLNITEPL